jgi:hypothetical protein
MHNESSAEKQGHDVTEAEHKEHLNHVLHQLQNKPWSALYVACIFYAYFIRCSFLIQQVAQAGWSPVLFRVMQGITSYFWLFFFSLLF